MDSLHRSRRHCDLVGDLDVADVWHQYFVATRTSRKIKQRLHRHPQPLRHLLNRLKRRRIDAALDQAQEIHRDPHALRELLLRELPLRADAPQTCAEIFTERSHHSAVALLSNLP